MADVETFLDGLAVLAEPVAVCVSCGARNCATREMHGWNDPPFCG